MRDAVIEEKKAFKAAKLAKTIPEVQLKRRRSQQEAKAMRDLRIAERVAGDSCRAGVSECFPSGWFCPAEEGEAAAGAEAEEAEVHSGRNVCEGV